MATIVITSPPANASELATTLIEKELAACVNRLSCESTYRWDGEIHEGPEVLLLVKTNESRYQEIVSLVEELHPHDVPCIERFDEADIFPPFQSWRDEASTSS